MMQFSITVVALLLLSYSCTQASTFSVFNLEEDPSKELKLVPRLMFEAIQEYEGPYEVLSFPRDDLNIPQLVKKLGLTTLLQLVVKAGLAEALSGKGPFTVFGPTNDAFSKLPKWEQKAVANKTVLAYVLKFHVLASEAPSSALKNDLMLPTLAGKDLRINLYKKDGETVATAQCKPIDLSRVDQKATNGLLHVLNGVMFPPQGNIVEFLAACPVFKTLVTAVKAASLVDALTGEGPFTLFAPSDKAFSKLPPGALEKLLKDPAKLKKVLLYHVVEGTACSAGLSSGKVPTLAKEDVTITVSKGGVKVNKANVSYADASVTNGVIHSIDAVLLPPDLVL